MPWVAGSRASSRAGVNRQFLLNTIHGLNSHNRREEEEDCWRQHRLEQTQQSHSHARDDTAGLSNSNATDARQQRKSFSTKATALRAQVSAASARRFWEERKRRAMTSKTAGTVVLGASVSQERGRDGRVAGKRAREPSDNDTDDDSVGARRDSISHGGENKQKCKRQRKSRDGGTRMKSDAEGSRCERECDSDRSRDRGRDRERTSTRKRKKAKKRSKANNK